MLDRTEAQYVTEYIYLGQLVSFDQGMEIEIKRRVTQAWRAFWSMKYILKDKSITRSLRLTEINTCIYPVLLYGCQTWSPTESQKMSVDVCQRKMERKLLGITNRDKISNRRLQELTEAENPTQRAACTKWRQQEDRLAQSTTMWDPYIGDRSRGRPRKRWVDFFKQHAGVHWFSIARNRKEWKNQGEQLKNKKELF
jgi:hypothetical protein